jgi:hypothetical protein
VIAITSFSPRGFELYGRKFLDSAVENWPTDILVYYEEKPDYDHPKVKWTPLMEVYGLNAFLEYCKANPIFEGRTPQGYNFNLDAAKFARKAFAQFDALQKLTGRVFWLDADMTFKKPVPTDFLNDVFDNRTIALLMREGLHAESGFVGFDTERDDFAHFLKTYIDIYRRGHLFKMRYWIDGHAIQEAVLKSGVSFRNLTAKWPDPTWAVLDHSTLGEYITHHKGRRKYDNADTVWAGVNP